MFVVNGEKVNKWNIKYDDIPDDHINADITIEVTLREFDFKRIVRYEKRHIKNGWRSGDLIYWKRNQWEYNNIAIDQIKEYMEV
jgi:hypothetical protein